MVHFPRLVCACRFDPRKDAMVCFAELAHSMPDGLAASVLQEINSRLVTHLADNCLLSPREFWLVHSLFFTVNRRLLLAVLSLPSRAHPQIAQNARPESATFASCTSLLCALGAKMVERDTYAPFALFVDFALPKLADAVKARVLRVSTPCSPAVPCSGHRPRRRHSGLSTTHIAFQGPRRG